MRHSIAWLFIVCLFSAGCHHDSAVVTADGSKVSVDGTTTKIETTNEKGEKVTAEMSSKEGDLTIKDANGNVSHVGSSASDADLGVDIYPGAKKEEAGGFSNETKDGKVMSFNYLTPDEIDAVVKYYKEKYPTWKTSEVTNDATKMAFFNLEEPKRKAMITVTHGKEDKETRISIMVELKN